MMRILMLATALLACVAPMARAQQPIFIVNGVRLDKCENASTTTAANPLPLAEINPDAIESIEVIKGAAAAKQYGADGANGVITVTLKKGSTVSPTLCDAPSKQPLCKVYLDNGREVGRTGCDGASSLKPAGDPIARYLYSPELVMAHQQAIGITDRQRTAIQDIVKEMQAKVVDVQLRLASETGKLTQLLSSATVDEAAALQEIDQVLALEREMKRAQVSLLVRVKNQLTAAQQGMLDKVR